MNARKLRRGLALPLSEQGLAIEALAFLGISRAVLAVLPFRIAMRGLGLRLAEGGGLDDADRNGPAPSPIVLLIGDAVRRAASVAPFKAVCLQQAVAASLMLRRRGYRTQIHFGVTKDEGGALIAHAWSRCHGKLVTGAQQMPHYQPISVFVT